MILPPFTRRRFLQQTFAFSATAMLTGCGSGIESASSVLASAAPAPASVVSHMLAVGDWGAESDRAAQSRVATAMQTYMAAEKFSPDAMLMLGDNFYGPLPDGEHSSRWKTQFEQKYPASDFNCPFYGVLGNHDYQVLPQDKVAAELAYAQQGTSRWTMPGPYYTFDFPTKNPVITFIALDSNRPHEPSQPLPPDSTYYTPTVDMVEAQEQWLEHTLKQPRKTPFLAFVAHHPVYSNGPHGDNQTLIKSLDPVLHKHAAHLYVAGHDHDLQHLEFANHPTSFVLSGGGGAELVDLKPGALPGPFSQKVHGFTHLQVQASLITVKHVGEDGTVLHGFSKTPAGVVTLLT